MKIIQVAHALHPTDAASRQLLHMDEILQELGYETAIYAHRADERLADRVGRMGDFEAEPGNIVIYHMTTGTSFNRWVWNYPRKIVLFYHNITPARYFFGNAWGSWLKCLRGRHDLKKIAKNTFFAWGASEYSRRELEAVGVERTAVLPIVVEPETYTGRGEDESVLRYQDGRLNLLVVGRGVPHKKQDEAIEAAAWYRDNISKDIRLVIIGNIKPSYEKKLHALVRERGMEENVLFAGQISDEALCTWYRIADGLLCLSEHEGFCVPLVEAMIFGLPIFAKPAAAVPETLGGAGVLLSDSSPAAVAMAVRQTLADELALARLKKGRAERLSAFSFERTKAKLDEDMRQIVRMWEKERQA
ncbi:MAG: glycosyltransferase family 4 protein [Schwartzia succinivorans]|nr:glycosyltransferase family 4 protein [Schwartzia succinivorans]